MRNRREEPQLIQHIRQQRAAAGAAAQRPRRIVAVNIVDGNAGMRGKIVVQRGLKRFHRQAGQHAGNARRDKFRLRIAPVRGGGERSQQFGNIGNVRQHTVNRRKHQRFVVKVHHLAKRPARGVNFPLLRRERGLELFPDRLGRGQRVVSVAHCEQRRIPARLIQGQQRALRGGKVVRIGHGPAG